MLVLGGRAPAFRWGQGSLQEIDHVPFVAPVVKYAATAQTTAQIPGLLDDALRIAITPHSGPAFIDFPLDQVFGEADAPPAPAPLPEPWTGAGADAAQIDRAAALLRDAERPVIMAGTGLYWGRGEAALTALAESLRIPVFLNGLGRGCLPADHELAFARARSAGLSQADVALVIGVPLDFRLGFGAVFADDAHVIAIDVAEPVRPHPRSLSAELYGALPATLSALADSAGAGAGARVTARKDWVDSLRAIETERRAGEAGELADGRAPLHPMRIYGELAQLLDRDAIVVGDGGDFVSFAGRVVDSYRPGCWLDPGPYGCLGSGPGYALAAKLAHPERQVVLLLGDGAFGFSGMEFDTLARHGVAVVGVIGNNGIWALEKHPMEAIYGYSVVADLRPRTRYDEVAEALGCHGELVSEPAELRPALERAFAAGGPALVNVLTDPGVAYPRRSNLA
jgi:acetolactate synthase-1/2/3 large subunit